jgi:hypothetical protein
MTDSTFSILEKMSGLEKKRTSKTSLSEAELPLDAPKLKLQPSTDMGEKLVNILRANFSHKNSPMDK